MHGTSIRRGPPRLIEAFAALVVAAMLLAPAGSGTALALSHAPGSPYAAKHVFYYLTPGPIGANQFLRLGATGTQQAAKKFGATTKVVQAQESPTSWEQTLSTAINAKPTIIVMIGFEFNDAL